MLFTDNKVNNSNILKNTAHVDFNDKNLDNVRFVKVNCMPATGEHLTVKNIMLATQFVIM